MRAFTKSRGFAPTALALVVVMSMIVGRWTAFGQDDPKPKIADVPKKVLSQGEKAILAIDESFVRDYNKGDSKALAAMFTEDAEAVEAAGDRFRSRAAIEARFADTFAANPGVQIAIETDAIRFVSPDVAQEEGRTFVSPAKGSPVESSFTILYVKHDGRWLISSVREDPVEVDRPHDRLKDLEWMVGEWIEERPDSSVRLSCRWSEDGNFLFRTAVVKREGLPVMTISQRIGWDPIARQIRSWDFDSGGGFGEGRWSRDAEAWVIKHSGVQAGRTSSETNHMSNERADVIRWVSTDRVSGGEALPDAEANVLVRIPPTPGVTPAGPATLTPSPSNTERSPR